MFPSPDRTRKAETITVLSKAKLHVCEFKNLLINLLIKRIINLGVCKIFLMIYTYMHIYIHFHVGLLIYISTFDKSSKC